MCGTLVLDALLRLGRLEVKGKGGGGEGRLGGWGVGVGECVRGELWA